MTTTNTVYQVVGQDGKVLNWGWTHREQADRDAARHPGATVSEYTYEVKPAPYKQVLIDSGIPEADWTRCCLAMNRMLNMTADAGRPSDAMRSVVRAYKSGHNL